jgi:hypothetical protein
MRFLSLALLITAAVARAQADAGELEQARELMKQSLQGELPRPSTHAKPEWPTEARRDEKPAPNRNANPNALEKDKDNKEKQNNRGGSDQAAAKRVDGLVERARNDAAVQAKATAEARKAEREDDAPGASQSRTNAAKAKMRGPPQNKPPRP